MTSPAAPYLLSGGVLTLGVAIAFGGDAGLAALAVFGTVSGVWAALTNEADMLEMRALVEARTKQLTEFDRQQALAALTASIDLTSKAMPTGLSAEDPLDVASHPELAFAALAVSRQAALARRVGVDSLTLDHLLRCLMILSPAADRPSVGEVREALLATAFELVDIR